MILSYDGTDFHGFQRQAKGRTVQDVVEKALRRLNWQGRYVLAAGRTDTGVHASGQVIAFDLDWGHPLEDLKQALNAYLPRDVVAREVRQVSVGFHPRRDALSRRYRYHIFPGAVRDPLRERFAWRVWPSPDFSILQQAAQAMVGRHDFAAFGTSPRSGGSTVRTVSRSIWSADGVEWVYEVTADAFLYHMVRRMVFLQVDIARGKLGLEAITEYLKPDHPSLPISYVQGLAPASGLVLVEVNYPVEACAENQL